MGQGFLIGGKGGALWPALDPRERLGVWLGSGRAGSGMRPLHASRSVWVGGAKTKPELAGGGAASPLHTPGMEITGLERGVTGDLIAALPKEPILLGEVSYSSIVWPEDPPVSPPPKA